MLRKLSSISVFLLLLTAPAYADGLEGCEHHVTYGAPSLKPALLCRLGYALSHNSKHKVPDWVAYRLTREKMRGTYPRSNNFRADPDLESGQRAVLLDYKLSGFDRGHMAPAAAMKWDARAMSESFLLSNMAPQVGNGFNRGIWRVLERNVRDWTSERGMLYVVTGPIYASEELQEIGGNNVSVPTHFYKVIFDPVQVEAIAFILKNAKLQTSDLPTFITSVDVVENLTGLDFLPKLQDAVEDVVESLVPSSMW